MQWKLASLDCETTKSTIVRCEFVWIQSVTTPPRASRCATIVALNTFTLLMRVGGFASEVRTSGPFATVTDPMTCPLAEHAECSPYVATVLSRYSCATRKLATFNAASKRPNSRRDAATSPRGPWRVTKEASIVVPLASHEANSVMMLSRVHFCFELVLGLVSSRIGASTTGKTNVARLI